MHIFRNHDKTYSACPVLTDTAAQDYLRNGTIPDGGAHYVEVPPGKIIRHRGVWLTPSYQAHAAAKMFLISTDVYEMNVDPLEAVRSQIFCYFSSKSKTHFIGRMNLFEQQGGAPKVLVPLLVDRLNSPMLLTDLAYTGRVIAAI
jgi:hypothetical protein